jgi:hypothetical protein
MTVRPIPPKSPFSAKALVAMLVLFLAPQDALAYVDPGSGLLLIQGLLAVIGGIIVFFKDPMAGFKRLWVRIFSRVRPPDP